MAKKVQLMTNAKQWQVVDGVEVLMDVPQEDLDPITDSSCVEIEGHRTLEETISQENMFTPKIIETKVRSKVGGVYHDNVVDGAYEEAILYGNTQVNLVESITAGTKYIPHSFTSFQGNESKIGNYNSGRTNQVAPLVKGVTMVNLAQTTSTTIVEGGNGGAIENVKSNTKYTLVLDFTVQNTQKGFSIQSFKDNTYLETSMIRTGMGEKVNFTFTTHEEANKIYIVNNSGYGGEIQLDNIMVIEGDVTDLDLPFFKGMRSVELSRPLTNLLHDGIYKTYGSTTQLNYSNGNVTVTANAIGTWQSANFHFINEDKLKPNTKYIVMWDSLTQTQTSTSSGSIIAVYDTKSGDGNINIGTANSKSECPVLRSIVFDTTGRDASGIVLRIHATLSKSETGTTTVTGLRVFEWDDSLRTLDLQTIGYFSDTKYVSAPRALETEGKNLYPYGDASFTATNTNVDSWYDHKGTAYMHGDVAQKSKARFLLKKGIYAITTGVWVNATACQLIDDKEQIVVKLDSGQRNHVFTLSQDTYCTLRIKASVVNTVTQIPNIQIERGETATTYEAYQSRYYKPRETEEIILRSLPNGVCDTFNLQTGELVQNIGEVVLDGSDDEDWLQLEFSGASTVNGIADTYICYGLLLKDKARLTKNMLFYGAERHVIDTLNISSVYGDTCNQADISTEMVCLHQNGRFYLRLRKDRFASTDLAGWKLWFSQNPITVQYELKEPIITKLQTYNRIYSGQTNALANMGNNLSALTYYANNYYLKVGNLSPVPGILEPITTIPYDVRLKPSTLYTVKYNRGGYSNSMKFDLGGSVVEKINATDLGIVPEEFTVRTPTILSHEQLQLSGTGFAHNFIIVEGDITGTELPYFEGMKDVKMPIVKNTNSDGTRVNSVYAVQGEIPITSEMIEQGGFSMSGSSDGSYENSKYAYTARLRSKELIPIKPNTTYAFAHSFSKFAYNVYQWNGNKEFIDGVSRYFASGQVETITTTADTQYIHFLMSKHDASQAITVGEYDWNDFHMYELDSTINLRSLPNGVKDELNLLTGEYIQRVEEVVLDGSERWTVGDGGVEEGMKYFMTSKNYPQGIKLNTTTTKLTTQAHGYSNITFSDVWNERKEGISSSNGTVGLRATSSKYSTVDEWKAFLQSNPITVQYELAEPIISHVRLVSNNQEREVGVKLPNGVCNTYNPSIGITTVRVGKVVLDGSEKFNGSYTAGATVQGMYYYTYDLPVKRNTTSKQLTTISSGGMKSIPFASLWLLEQEGVSSSNSEGLGLRFATKCATASELQQYFASNPTTVWYELNYPQIQPNIVLPNGVHDEYNPLTGLYTKRVGYVELDGSENWKEDVTEGAKQPNTHIYYTPTYPNMKPLTTDLRKGGIICDSYTVIGNIYFLDEVGLMINTDPRIYIRDKIATVNEFKTHLAQNPVKVWYELQTPITYQLTPYFGLPQPYAYEDGYLIMDSAYPETTLPPEFKYKLVANRTGQVMQNSRKLQEHTTRLSNLEALIIEATIESLFNRELQLFELELMDIQLIDLGE